MDSFHLPDAPEQHIKRIVLHRMDRCAVCHREFEIDDIRVLSRKPDMWMMLVECTDCHARNFVAAVLNDGDPDEARLALRRLSDEAREGGLGVGTVEPPIEPAPPGADAPISAHDVLEMHEFLRAFDGDFRRLFRAARG
jgi:hypothetical protein